MQQQQLDEQPSPAEVIPLRRGPRSHQWAQTAMLLFLGSWAVTFVALFVGYTLIRLRQPAWPPAGAPPLPHVSPWLNTLVAFASSVTFELAVRRVRDGRSPGRWLAVTWVQGALFLALQLGTWWSLWQAGLRLGQGVYAGMFYALTFFHALHVVCALALVAWLLVAARRFGARDHLPVKFTGWFWHFVTVAWVGVLLALYVL